MTKLGKGIKGIRQIIRTNESGWHIHLNGSYVRYSPESLNYILNEYPSNFTATAIFGNVIVLEGGEK